MNRQPLLVIVTGRPGAGKSTLACRLKATLRVPMVCRDEIKEGHIRTLGGPERMDSELPGRVNDAFFSNIDLFIDRGVSHLAVAAFQHKVWEPRLEPLLKRVDLRIIVCQVTGAVAVERQAERDRHDPERVAYHPYPPGYDGLEFLYDPPRLNVPMIIVNTESGYEPGFDSVVEFLEPAR
jgi:predicted kinase